MKVNRVILYFLFFTVLSIVFIYYKKQLEHFKELIIESSSDVSILSKKKLFDPESWKSYRFKRICVGNTCMDGNVLASTLELFRHNDTKLRTISTCSDNVCLFSDHLKIFNNSNKLKPDIVNPSDVNDASKVKPYGDIYNSIGRGITNDGFRLSLGGSTDEVLEGLGTNVYEVGAKQEKRRSEVNPKPFVTRMIPGRICYAPNTSIPYQISFQDTSKSSPYKVGNAFEKKHFQYFDYDTNKSTPFGTFGKPGVKDYTYCYSNNIAGDYLYNSKSTLAFPLMFNTDDVLKKNNMIADDNLATAISFNIWEPTKNFIFGKPYDKTKVLPSTQSTSTTEPTVTESSGRTSSNSDVSGTYYSLGS